MFKIKTTRKTVMLSLISVIALAGSSVAIVNAMAADTPLPPSAINQVTAVKAGQPNALIAPPATQPTTTNAPARPAAAKPATPTAANAPAKVAAVIPKGVSLYAASDYGATVRAAANSAGSSSDAAVLNRLAGKSTARWFGDWSGNITSAVNSYVSSAQAAGQLPVMVAYNIPFRDCGGESAGGLSGASAYDSWIRGFASGVNGRRAIVILEPDAVAADCFSASRAAMLTNAVNVLAAAGASVYLDGGNPTWRTASDMAARLKQANIAAATGFSLNVSNYQTTASNISYGTKIAGLTGDKHVVIDTSRNGVGPTANYEWCNPAGRALGAEPTTQTGNRLVDAYLWVKVPGESDGNCGPAIGASQPPAAGAFWPEYALMLARNAGW